MSTECRIYVACLASYNAGILHGEWIDVTNVDTINAEIAKILRTSTQPNVFRQDYRCTGCNIDFTRQVDGPGDLTADTRCPECDVSVDVKVVGAAYTSAEEWAVHDTEGFGKIQLGEHPDLETLVSLAEKIAEHDGPFLAWADYQGNDLQRAIDTFNEAYRGTYASAADYAEEFMKDAGAEIPENLAAYIDYERMAKDWDLGGDIITIDHGHSEVFIFDGHV